MHETYDIHYMIRLHKDCNDKIADRISDLTERDLECAATPVTRKAKRMLGEVRREYHLMKGFVRLKKIGKLAYYGHMRPQNNIGHLVAESLAKRFPYTIIILGNSSISWVSLLTKEGLVSASDGQLRKTVLKISGLLDSKNEELGIEDIWREYYCSQCRDERSSTRRFFRSMPHSHIRAAGLNMEKGPTPLTLDDFIPVL